MNSEDKDCQAEDHIDSTEKPEEKPREKQNVEEHAAQKHNVPPGEECEPEEHHNRDRDRNEIEHDSHDIPPPIT